MSVAKILLTTVILTASLGACRTTPETTPRQVDFRAADGVTLFADVYPSRRGREAAVVLLFHQAGGDARGEYGPVIPRLVERGLNVIAVDLRSGGDRFGVVNRTVERIEGREFTYCDGYPDLEAALEYAESKGFVGPRILWGSSYSASLAIRLAAEHPEGVAGVLAFSPAASGPMEACKPDPYLAELRTPLLSLRPTSEMPLPGVVQQNERIRESGHSVYEAVDGVHGSSMLVAERAGGDTEPTWERVLSFIDGAIGE